MSQPSSVAAIKAEIARLLALGALRLAARENQLAECGGTERAFGSPVEERPDSTQEANR